MKYMNLHHKYGQFLVYAAVFNALVGVLALVSIGILVHKNPELCFRYSCSSSYELKGEEMNGYINPLLKDVDPVATPDIQSSNIPAKTTTVSNKSAIDDFTEKQYIHSLVGSYKNKILISSEHQEEVKNSPEQEQINALVKATPFDKQNVSFWDQVTSLQAQRSARINSEIKTKYGNIFCSSSQILLSYKDYCLSLF